MSSSDIPVVSDTPVFLCPKCGEPMQLYNEARQGTRVIQRTYIHGCQGVPFFRNVIDIEDQKPK